jgi:isoleucyl-tRNA synthetase
VDLKNTLNLPATDFPMKANLSEKEPQAIAEWTEKKLYHEILKKNHGRPKFVMPDGPPYANGNIHIGHVLNKCLKDFVVKYKNMSGFSAAFIPGWDCHGLPIELKVTKDLGPKRKEKTEAEIRELCRTEAKKWIEIQKAQFMRLGILAEWENPYLTLSPEYEAEEVRELARCLKKGVLYRGEKPVYWCPTLQTALAEAEVEYAPHKSTSVYVKFFIEKGLEKFAQFSKPVAVVIWTTTPWTLPANLGIAFHPDFEYQFFETEKDYLLIATELKDAFEKETGVMLTASGIKVKGASLDRMTAKHPFINRESLFVLGDHVSLDAGTGAVHTAPGHGQDDYKVGLKYGLAVLSPVDAAGKYTNEVPEYEGMKIFDANPIIVERLRESGHLIHSKIFEHSYPHNWRSLTPLIFRATPQWFLGMDLEANPIRKQALEALKSIQFVPKWGESRLRSMIENRPDWTLSRQRIWGVPIPVFYCEKCEQEILEVEVMEKVADLMEKNGGIEAYHNLPITDFIGDRKCQKCGGKDFKRGQDILDVWFDSGSCHAAVQNKRPELSSPADIYLEGSDQHRGWFQTSLLSSIASTGHAPFKALVTHGFVNDAKGRKMSKSLGNVIDPADTWKKDGAEILRLWATYEDFGNDLSCGPESFLRITESYRKFRNTIRFMLGNLGDFDPLKDQVPYSQMTALDQLALSKLNDLIIKTTDAYEKYEFFKVYHALNNFFTVDLSAAYLDMLKDRLYTWKKDSPERRSSQTVIFELLSHLIRIMAPITSFLSEESLQYMPSNKAKSVFLLEFPKPNKAWDNPQVKEDFEKIFEVRTDVSKALEELRREKVIGSGLDARLKISAEKNAFQLLKKYEKNLPEYFIVSQVELHEGPYKLSVNKALGAKCDRCWYYDEHLGESAKFPTVCPKCVRALE